MAFCAGGCAGECCRQCDIDRGCRFWLPHWLNHKTDADQQIVEHRSALTNSGVVGDFDVGGSGRGHPNASTRSTLQQFAHSGVNDDRKT